MRVPKDEREINAGGYTYAADGTKAKTMTVYTSDYGYMLKFDRFCEKSPEDWQCIDVLYSGEDVVGKRYVCPTSCLSFRSGVKKMTEEQRQKAAERMRKRREAQDTLATQA